MSIIAGLTLPGWFCGNCKGFNGEAKVKHDTCIYCDCPRTYARKWKMVIGHPVNIVLCPGCNNRFEWMLVIVEGGASIPCLLCKGHITLTVKPGLKFSIEDAT